MHAACMRPDDCRTLGVLHYMNYALHRALSMLHCVVAHCVVSSTMQTIDNLSAVLCSLLTGPCDSFNEVVPQIALEQVKNARANSTPQEMFGSMQGKQILFVCFNSALLSSSKMFWHHAGLAVQPAIPTLY